MKSGFIVLLAGLFLLSMFPAQGVAGFNRGPVQYHPVELRGDVIDHEVPAGPNRDQPGDDWIIYDDGTPRYISVWVPHWNRVRFTPNADFTLMAVRFRVQNNNDVDDDCNVYVYSENQQSHDLDELLWEFTIEDNLPNNEWIDLEFDEDDYIDFAGSEHFSIIYGPAPSGDPRQGGEGWWNLLDAATDVHRSFLARGDDPPQDHDQWGVNDSDLLLRANGEIADFVDVGIDWIKNDSEMWMMYQETEQTFIVSVTNIGSEVGFVIVSFNIYDEDDNAVWEEPYEMVIEDPFEDDETIEVECEQAWVAGEAGHYFCEVIIDLEDDADQDNNLMRIEQLVVDPENAPDTWLGYCDEAHDSRFMGGEGDGWMPAFPHPGGETQLTISNFRYYFDATGTDGAEVLFGIGVRTVNGNRFEWRVRDITADVSADYQDWVEVELSDEERDLCSFGEGQEVHISYFWSGLVLCTDGTPPISGVNPEMPSTMYVSIENGDRFGPAEGGDYMCQAQFAVSDVIPPGKLLSIEPDTVDFGEDLAIERPYVIEATFTAYGDENVIISAIQVAGSAADYVTVDPTEFEIEAQSEQIVTLTFHAAEPVELASTMRVINDSENLSRQHYWRVLAKTVLDVDDDQTRLPAEYQLLQNHPNPFNPTTTIDFALKTPGMVNLSVYDMKGRLVSEVLNGHLDSGYHSLEFDAESLPAGIYFYSLAAGEFNSVRKMILMK